MDLQTQSTSVFDELEQERLFDYATTGQRFINFLFDSIILVSILSGIVGASVGIVMVLNGIDVDQAAIVADPIYSKLFNYGVNGLCVILLYTLMEGASKGRSLGKLVTKTLVLKEDGSAITFKDAWLRSLCRIVPLEVFSAFGGHPWHDRWTRTIVVKKH